MDAIEDIADSVEVGGDLVMSDVAPIAIDTEAPIESPERRCDDTSYKPKDDDLNHDGATEDIGAEEQLLDEAELQLALESESRSVTNLKPRLRPIEVVLTPPLNPDEYEILSPSFVVDRVLEEVRTGDDSWFSVEYSDGRIEQVSNAAISRIFFICIRNVLANIPPTIRSMLFVTAVHICLEERKDMLRFVGRIHKCIHKFALLS